MVRPKPFHHISTMGVLTRLPKSVRRCLATPNSSKCPIQARYAGARGFARIVTSLAASQLRAGPARSSPRKRAAGRHPQHAFVRHRGPGPIWRSDTAAACDIQANGYPQSKWLAEMMVFEAGLVGIEASAPFIQAARQGLPAFVHRPGLIGTELRYV